MFGRGFVQLNWSSQKSVDKWLATKSKVGRQIVGGQAESR